MTETVSPLVVNDEPKGLFKTRRKDLWWVKPVSQGLLLTVFIIYSIWSMFTVKGSSYEQYRSPIYAVSEVGFSWWPSNLSPALLLIWAPIGFRATCYYARKVYYRAFLLDPPACAVEELRSPKKEYKGETILPWVLNNLHRYFWYAAVILLVIHWYELIFHTIYYEGEILVGLGTLLLFLDVTFLSLYVFSCHAGKHFLFGGRDCYSCSKFGLLRYKTWNSIKRINVDHHAYFWLSLISVLVVDIYIRLLSAGKITEIVWIRWTL